MAILNPYLQFAGDAREALTFYQSVFGGDLNVMTFGDMQTAEHEGQPIPADGVMHGQLTTDQGFTLMGADLPNDTSTPQNGSVSLSGDEDDLLHGYFDRLADGGTVTVPLEKAPWGDSFGMATDRFGIEWLVNISSQSGGGPSA